MLITVHVYFYTVFCRRNHGFDVDFGRLTVSKCTAGISPASKRFWGFSSLFSARPSSSRGTE